MLQKHRDAVTTEGCGNYESMCRYEFQPDSRWRRGYHRGCVCIKVPGTASGPSRRQLAGCHTEYSKGESDLGWLGKILRQEGAYTILLAVFYHAVVHTILIFGADKWVLKYLTKTRIDGVHTGFLQQVTGNRKMRQQDRYWRR